MARGSCGAWRSSACVSLGLLQEAGGWASGFQGPFWIERLVIQRVEFPNSVPASPPTPPFPGPEALCLEVAFTEAMTQCPEGAFCAFR